MKAKLSFAHTASCRITSAATGGAKGTNTKGHKMKLQIKMLVAALAIASSAAYLVAQDDPGQGPHHGPPGGGPGGPGGRRMPPPPLVAILDANHDGVIDSTEIDNAPTALRALDKNGDGKLTPDELRPPRPQGRGFRGPGPHDGPPDDLPKQDN